MITENYMRLQSLKSLCVKGSGVNMLIPQGFQNLLRTTRVSRVRTPDGVPTNPDVSRTSGFLYVSDISRFVSFPTFFPQFVYPTAIFESVSTAFTFSSNPTFT